MKNIYFLSVSVLYLLLTMNACGSNFTKTVHGNGNVTKEQREVGSFNTISASSGVNVFLFQGTEEKVIVEADENLQGCIKTRVEGNTLKCYIDCSVRSSKKLNVYVNYKLLEKIKASSGADVFSETLVQSDRLEVNVSSGADVKLEVDANYLNANVSSGSDLFLKGKAETFYGDASSGADIKADELKAKDCKLNASSAGDIRVFALEKIDCHASSGGDITFYGNPSFVELNQSSGGDIKHRN